MRRFETFTHCNMIAMEALANISITPCGCQYSNREIRKMKMWGHGEEKQEGPGNSSVKGPIVKVVDFEGCKF